MVGKGGIGDFDACLRCFFHQYTGKHVDLRAASGVDVLQSGEAGLRADPAVSVFIVDHFDPIGSRDADGLVKKAVVYKTHVFAVDIGFVSDIQDRLRKVISHVQGKFLPLLSLDLAGEPMADPRLFQEPSQGSCPRGLLGCVLFPIDQTRGIQIVIDPVSDPLGSNDHIGVQQMLCPDGFRQDLLAVHAVQRADDRRVRRGHMPQIL